MSKQPNNLLSTFEHDSCGVGFITNKHSKQTHQILKYVHQSLCKVPHRGGMNANGVGDGAGINIDLSVDFYRHLTGNQSLQLGEFGVANFFMPNKSDSSYINCERLIENILSKHKLPILLKRDVPVDADAINPYSQAAQQPILQWVFGEPEHVENDWAEFSHIIREALIELENIAFQDSGYHQMYPLSMSARTQVYKGLLNSWEVVPYFKDLTNPIHKVSMLFFHTRFSTNTAPNIFFAQPFRRMAHNGELNTDRKNRLSEDAIARHHGKTLIFPPGQSDSARLDQTLTRRIHEDKLSVDTAILQMMPPAWENETNYDENVRDMLAYFSLFEEKNDGPAAIVFSDGIKIGARLDRLGLRPLRVVETGDYLAVTSEAGQIDFNPDDVTRRSRIEAGGMILFDHTNQKIWQSDEILKQMASKKDYKQLLNDASYQLVDLPKKPLSDFNINDTLPLSARHIAYGLNQESFKFMLDPMLQTGAEKVSAMGYGIAPSGLSGDEGGLFRYFTQRFAQVTNPPLDSIRESDGMTLRVNLGGKPFFKRHQTKQLITDSPIIDPQQLLQIYEAGDNNQLNVAKIETLYDYQKSLSLSEQEHAVENAITSVCEQVITAFSNGKDIVVLDDSGISQSKIALPAVLTISAVNQQLVEKGLRFDGSLIYVTGQACSTHDVAVLLGFGASAVLPLTAYERAMILNGNDLSLVEQSLKSFKKAIQKSLLKTMGKIGLCTVESYIGGEFFEASFLDTSDPKLKKVFPHIDSPLAGARYQDIVQSSINWHQKMLSIVNEEDVSVPLLGLFKERNEGAGHTFGNIAVKAYTAMTEEQNDLSNIEAPSKTQFNEDANALDIALPHTTSEQINRIEKLSDEQINQHQITQGYKDFIGDLSQERKLRPAALRDILAFPIDLSDCQTPQDFELKIKLINPVGNISCPVQGLSVSVVQQSETQSSVELSLAQPSLERHKSLQQAILTYVAEQVENTSCDEKSIQLTLNVPPSFWLLCLSQVDDAISINEVEHATEILPNFATGAMSYGSLIAKTHEAIAVGLNMVNAKSNCGEGGENIKRFNTLKGSKIKQIASGRFGVWTGYFADPMLEEIEIKIAQGAKPGEGGQLPGKKVTVEIAASRGGTPGVELVSPPPHHDTYSIEDLAQLIHDAKAARVRVIVKLASTEGIGTIAVGVAKAGADLINVAGNTGGTGAAQVTSLKHTGRIAELGIAEVHQALCAHGFRDKITLRCSNAHQTASDVIKSAMMGADSFEFGTAALMMLKCVMAKNCNVKCPAGLTTNPEVFDGDPKTLGLYFVNIAHEVREILASLGAKSLKDIRGRTDLLYLTEHPNIVGRLDMSKLLYQAENKHIENPIYLEKDYELDDEMMDWLQQAWDGREPFAPQNLGEYKLTNTNKSFGGQLSIDIERWLNYQSPEILNSDLVKYQSDKGRYVLSDSTITINTYQSAGQSYGLLNNSGITLIHKGTCNDGVGKSMSGGRIVIKNSGGGDLSDTTKGNVLVGNFALFGATGGRLFIEGQAGDRFSVRNSGAFAVVEGVGDFCCEYMTGGVVVNLGGYGKGFANGMSGGIAFQYDPTGQIVNRCAQDSVKCFNLSSQSSDEFIEQQKQSLLRYLKAHRRRTNSDTVRTLLKDWDNSYQHFYILIPKAWYANHCISDLSQKIDAKTWIEEIAQDASRELIEKMAVAYRNNEALFEGKVPSYHDDNEELSYQLTAMVGIFSQAVEQANTLMLKQKSKQKKNSVSDNDTKDVQKVLSYAKQLITGHYQGLIEQVYKDIKLAITGIKDEDLVPMIAEKRLGDYIKAYSMRAVNDSLLDSVFIWVDYQQKVNRLAAKKQGSLHRHLADYYSDILNKTLINSDDLSAETKA